jgi:hypothetical protein
MTVVAEEDLKPAELAKVEQLDAYAVEELNLSPTLFQPRDKIAVSTGLLFQHSRPGIVLRELRSGLYTILLYEVGKRTKFFTFDCRQLSCILGRMLNKIRQTNACRMQFQASNSIPHLCRNNSFCGRNSHFEEWNSLSSSHQPICEGRMSSGQHRSAAQNAVGALGELLEAMRDPYRASLKFIPEFVQQEPWWNDLLSRVVSLQDDIQTKIPSDAEVKESVTRLFAEVMDFIRRRIYDGSMGVVAAVERFDDSFFKALNPRMNGPVQVRDFKVVLFELVYDARAGLDELEPYIRTPFDGGTIVDNATIDDAVKNINWNMMRIFSELVHDAVNNHQLYAPFAYNSAVVSDVLWLCAAYRRIVQIWRTFAASINPRAPRFSALRMVRDAVE